MCSFVFSHYFFSPLFILFLQYTSSSSHLADSQKQYQIPNSFSLCVSAFPADNRRKSSPDLHLQKTARAAERGRPVQAGTAPVLREDPAAVQTVSAAPPPQSSAVQTHSEATALMSPHSKTMFYHPFSRFLLKVAVNSRFSIFTSYLTFSHYIWNITLANLILLSYLLWKQERYGLYVNQLRPAYIFHTSDKYNYPGS